MITKEEYETNLEAAKMACHIVSELLKDIDITKNALEAHEACLKLSTLLLMIAVWADSRPEGE